MTKNDNGSAETRRGDRVAAALRADVRRPLDSSVRFDPASLQSLAAQVTQRLRSTGGRPTDPTWSVTRQIPFSDETWTHLGELSQDLSARGRRIAPGQIAAMLVEEAVAQLGHRSVDESLNELDRHVEAHARTEHDQD